MVILVLWHILSVVYQLGGEICSKLDRMLASSRDTRCVLTRFAAGSASWRGVGGFVANAWKV